ncbi:MAG: serine/threonine-protein kinase [Myxococcota bacterium]
MEPRDSTTGVGTPHSDDAALAFTEPGASPRVAWPRLDSDERVGTIFAERYRILRRVARGSMGVVYEAEQLQLNRTVAIKVLAASPHQVSARDLSVRFLREASLLSKLSHPNTVRVFDYGVEDDRPFLVMEFVRGPTLRQLVNAGPIEPLRLLRIANQICGSLSEAHGIGIIHRDLKPANVLIAEGKDGTDLVKVVDFGLVKEVEGASEMTADGLILGTPQFMAPEQIRGHALDQRCDVYAMGVLLFKCLTGEYPFPHAGPAAVLEAHLMKTPRAIREVLPELDIPSAVQWTIDRCLAKDRTQRFIDAGQLQRALRLCEAGLLDESTSTFASPVLVDGKIDVRPIKRAQPQRTSRRLKIALLLAGLAVAMSAGLVAGYGLTIQLGNPWLLEMVW